MARSNGLGPAVIATLAALPAAVLAGVLIFWLLGGVSRDVPAPTPTQSGPVPAASGPVSADAPVLAERPATVCRALTARLPESLAGWQRRPVTAGAEQNAAYGEPPVLLSCGVARPDVAQDAQLVAMSGVCWWAQERADAAVWTTVDREVPVRVTVPKPVTGEWIVNLSPTIVAVVPKTEGPSGLC
jgi:hypothetical protein